MSHMNWQLPIIRRGSLTIWRRNILVWRKLLGPAIVMNFGEPALYLLGLGFGLGFFIGEMANMPYLTSVSYTHLTLPTKRIV